MRKHCWDYDEVGRGPHHKDFIRGYMDDGYEDAPYRSRSKKKVLPKKKPGCSENNGGAHVYVWTTEGEREDLFYRYFRFHKYERKVCCGCGKYYRSGRRFSTGRRLSEQYVKKFGNRPRYDYQAPERDNQGYAEYRKRWLTQRGYTWEYFGF